MSRSGGYKCYNIRCSSCIGKTLCGEPADAALGCENRIVSKETNADRIRAMSDEELAVFLESSRGCPSDDDCEYGVHATPENCIKHWTTWLQKPAEDA